MRRRMRRPLIACLWPGSPLTPRRRARCAATNAAPLTAGTASLSTQYTQVSHSSRHRSKVARSSPRVARRNRTSDHRTLPRAATTEARNRLTTRTRRASGSVGRSPRAPADATREDFDHVLEHVVVVFNCAQDVLDASSRAGVAVDVLASSTSRSRVRGRLADTGAVARTRMSSFGVRRAVGAGVAIRPRCLPAGGSAARRESVPEVVSSATKSSMVGSLSGAGSCSLVGDKCSGVGQRRQATR